MKYSNITEGAYNSIKSLLGLRGVDSLHILDIVDITSLTYEEVEKIDISKSYNEFQGLRAVYIDSTGEFKRIVLDDYHNGRLRLSCTNEYIHPSAHLRGKCNLSTIWDSEQIEYNGYILSEETVENTADGES